MRILTPLLSVLFFIISIFFYASSAVHAASFNDVPASHAQYEGIEYLKRQGVIKGYADGSFKPYQSVNRVEALKMILLTAGISSSTPSSSNFSDVGVSEWFAPYVMTAYGKKIVSGDGNTGKFVPTRTVQKSEFLKMTLLSFGKNTSQHQNRSGVANDVASSAWYTQYMSYAKAIGLIVPNASNNLIPGKQLTRAECADILYKMVVVEKGGEVQKLLNLADATLVSVLLSLSNNDVSAARSQVDLAVSYTSSALAKNDAGIVKAAHEISLGVEELVKGYEAGIVQNFEAVVSHANAAKEKAGQAYVYSPSTQNIGKKIKSYADVLLEQVN